mmetsp:Transcript_8548/g.26516  ORF Transcript_8548/g.26516 Transcript_8548/m.26516 type:complete len:322 (+) Transcript_8548:2116-3081(+)
MLSQRLICHAKLKFYVLLSLEAHHQMRISDVTLTYRWTETDHKVVVPLIPRKFGQTCDVVVRDLPGRLGMYLHVGGKQFHIEATTRDHEHHARERNPPGASLIVHIGVLEHDVTEEHTWSDFLRIVLLASWSEGGVLLGHVEAKLHQAVTLGRLTAASRAMKLQCDIVTSRHRALVHVGERHLKGQLAVHVELQRLAVHCDISPVPTFGRWCDLIERQFPHLGHKFVDTIEIGFFEANKLDGASTLHGEAKLIERTQTDPSATLHVNGTNGYGFATFGLPTNTRLAHFQHTSLPKVILSTQKDVGKLYCFRHDVFFFFFFR